MGSVKTNIGHLGSAADVAGVIKTVLALAHRRIPPHLHCAHPTPHVAWDRLPVTLATQGIDWPRENGPRLAGVSSFSRMREEPEYAGVPVLVLTGIASSQLKRLLGAEAVFVKPFDTGQLRRELARLCRRDPGRPPRA